MRASEFPDHHLTVRSTSGQRLDIRYDPRTNAILFAEDDWSPDGRGGASSRNVSRKQLGTPRLVLLRRRAA